MRQDGLVNPEGQPFRLPKDGSEDDKAPPREVKLPRSESREERVDYWHRIGEGFAGRKKL